MVRHLREVWAAWPLAMTMGCADDRIARSEGAAPNGEGSSGTTSPPDERSADVAPAGIDKPGPIVADNGVSVGDGTPAGGQAPDVDVVGEPTGSGGAVTPDASFPDAAAASPDAGAPSDGGGPLCAPGQPRRAIVQWSDVRRFSRDEPNTFQIVLF